ncbi:hypothetical protein FVB32_02870 [Flagellimonas hymeniacidonis]|uniref:Lipocalin-like domain-containing protein n=1 Tax=Flagellimonas hymeniacidonis TaxID=2603628 RepID=A0A5C8V5X4_9FLAO|nr:lipocalin family protein [Flagellimonas hymeniacidonis]TXN37245.1 hypothetical protein FVB32_02870 [Flagellimonas hymeniacidonis]
MFKSFKFPYLRNFNLIIPLLGLLFFGCSKDDDGSVSNSFYAGALKSTTISNLVGTWSIFEAESDGNRVSVPPTTQDCGRDFFSFSTENRYSEFLFTSSSCVPETNNYNVDLLNGVVTLTNQFGQKEELVITELTSEILNFRAQFDIDEDGVLDILTFYARRYSPPAEMDIYSSTFIHNNTVEYLDKIQMSWEPYKGYNQFSRYEIYRNAGDCDKTNAELIATLNSPDQGFFIDENPAINSNLCYYFRIYTDQGLLGESEMVSVDTGRLEVSSVTVSEPVVGSESIGLNWSKYSGRYFSHYEVTARNYQSGSGYGYQEVTIATVDDVDTLEYIDNDPPYFANPVYSVHVIDIFGNKSLGTIEGANSWQTNFIRNGLLELDFIRKLAIDPDETIIYLYGRESGTQELNIIRYNYNTHSIEATSDLPPSAHTDVDMKVIASEEGKEILFAQGSSINVYEATSLNFKYEMRVVGLFPSFDDLAYLNDNVWVFTDSDDVFTCSRNGKDLNLIDSEIHFNEHQSSNNYQIIALDNNQVLVGHSNEPNSLRFTIDINGFLTDRNTVPIPILSDWKKETFYNANQSYIINLVEGQIYSTTGYAVIDSFSEPNFSYGISNDGNRIFGSENDPNAIDLLSSMHEKKAYAYNRANQALEQYETKGYPHFIFENHLGQLISISSGLLRPRLDFGMPSPDFFIEIVD